MLVVSRKLSESITIGPEPHLDPAITLSEAFKDGVIQIKLVHIGGNRVKVAIEAPPHLRICRGESISERPAAARGKDERCG